MNLHFDHYYTHAPLLAKCVANTTGPILELGTGVYSTSLLDCLAGSRTVVSTDSNLDFLSELKTQFESPTHKFVHIDTDSAIKYNDIMDKFAQSLTEKQSIVFIDHEFIEERRNDIVRFRDLADLIVVHDSSYTGNPGHDAQTYKYNPLIEQFKYTYEYTKLWPFTCVMSDTNNLEWI